MFRTVRVLHRSSTDYVHALCVAAVAVYNKQQFKAKAWIDVFGSRCAKGVGSIITGSSNGNPDVLVTYGRCATQPQVTLQACISVGIKYTDAALSAQVIYCIIVLLA
jgi:hypothetical protein